MIQSQNKIIPVPQAHVLLQEKRQADAIKGNSMQNISSSVKAALNLIFP